LLALLSECIFDSLQGFGKCRLGLLTDSLRWTRRDRPTIDRCSQDRLYFWRLVCKDDWHEVSLLLFARRYQLGVQ
jgi:hypothetical protein